MSDLDRHIERLMAEDPDFEREYERLGPLYDAIGASISYRNDKGLTQQQLADKMGKKQPAIARFENGNVWPNLRFLQDLAEAMDARLVVRFERRGEAAGARPARIAEEKATYAAGSGHKRKGG